MAKQNKKVTKVVVSSGNEMAKFIKMILIVGVLFLVFYGITILVNKSKDKEEEKEDTPATIQYDTILIGNLLTQPNDVYYVLAKDSKNTDNSIYETYLTAYKKLEKANRVYYAHLDNPLNTRFVGTESNTNITDILDLRLKGTTLLKIEKGKITKVYEEKDDLIKFLKELSETKDEEKK